MAEKASATTFESVMSSLKAGNFSPAYLLMGEESYYIDQIADYIAEHALHPEERDFNQQIVFGADVSAAQVADMARNYPVMAERQVIIVKEAQNIKKWEQLEKYLEKPAKTTVLVVCYKNGTIDGRKKILTRFKSAGVVFESKKKRDYELPAFIEGYLKRRTKATIENKAAQMMADFIGSDLSRLTSELDKLILSLSESETRITPQIVEQRIGISKDFNAFEFRSAIAAKDVMKANMIVNYFDSNPKTGGAFVLVPIIFSYFQNLMIAYYAPNRNNDASVAEWLDLRAAWAARDYMAGMKNYTGTKVMRIIDKIRETDAKTKGLDNPNTPAGELLKELVFFIMH
jgi:DNA polymerase III subunit delta